MWIESILHAILFTRARIILIMYVERNHESEDTICEQLTDLCHTNKIDKYTCNLSHYDCVLHTCSSQGWANVNLSHIILQSHAQSLCFLLVGQELQLTPDNSNPHQLEVIFISLQVIFCVILHLITRTSDNFQEPFSISSEGLSYRESTVLRFEYWLSGNSRRLFKILGNFRVYLWLRYLL